MIECWIRQSKKCSNNHKKKTIFPVQKNTFFEFLTTNHNDLFNCPFLACFPFISHKEANMSGICGVMISEKLNDSVTSSLITSLTMLQHRGQSIPFSAVRSRSPLLHRRRLRHRCLRQRQNHLQEASGSHFNVCPSPVLSVESYPSLLPSVFNNDTISRINGYYGIGQCHNNFFYNSLGSEPQPAYCNMPYPPAPPLPSWSP